ncbi:MAG: hypothetical protein A6F70_10615 [Cycloclasticus sp. symbiont of Bathymodiolus heckerae]|nr:MAG: hypothetical protein A6F70_10615 [Cycloclasticus sp. symbiont of Bathymodiolus heckerae]
MNSPKPKLPEINEEDRTPLVDVLLEVLAWQQKQIDKLEQEILKLKGETTKPKIKPSSRVPNKAKDNVERKAATVHNTEKVSSLDISSFLPSSLDENKTKNDLNEKQKIDSGENPGVLANDKNIHQCSPISSIQELTEPSKHTSGRPEAFL